jgi:hypothetical protein
MERSCSDAVIYVETSCCPNGGVAVGSILIVIGNVSSGE